MLTSKGWCDMIGVDFIEEGVMSYYNYIYEPVKLSRLPDYNSEEVLFWWYERGFDELVNVIGDMWVNYHQGMRYIYLMESYSVSDYIRPYDLSFRLSKRPTYIGEPDCAILVSDLYERIKSGNNKDKHFIKAVETYKDNTGTNIPKLIYPM